MPDEELALERFEDDGGIPVNDPAPASDTYLGDLS
jgi:hypothetical protein